MSTAPDGNGDDGSATEARAKWSSIVAAEIEQFVIGNQRKYTREQVADQTGLTVAEAGRLWLALGFPIDLDPNAQVYTDDDVAALRTITGLVQDGTIDEGLHIAMVRTLGQAMARLAEWQVDLLTSRVLAEISAQGPEAVSPEDVHQIVEHSALRVMSASTELQAYAWRRHFAASAGRSIAATASDPSARELSVGFVDMVGYTRLTRHLDARSLAELLELFESQATETISLHKGWVIKNLGDEVMFAVERPENAARIALALQEAHWDLPDFPELRVGLAHGQVLQRFGDLYGEVVNVAARLTGVARPGTILVDTQLAELLSDVSDLTFKHLRAVRVRGYSRLRARVLRRDFGG